MKKVLQVLICSFLVFAVADTSFAWWFLGGGSGGKKSSKSTATVTTPAQQGNSLSAIQPKSVEVNVPEPATMILLGTGLIGLAVSQRKKFKK